MLSRLIVQIASHSNLAGELVFRGGTCLHKLHLPRALRYSEDLDYVRATKGPIGPTLDALRDVAGALGMEVRTGVREFPKVFLRGAFESGSGRMQIKIEINTHEVSPAVPHVRLPFMVESMWWSGAADVLTFQAEELIATKLRALFQRRKGRDLFDLWLALTTMGLDRRLLVNCFTPYRPQGYSAPRAIANLHDHLTDPLFRNDLRDLVQEQPSGYDPDVAGTLVREELLTIVDNRG